MRNRGKFDEQAGGEGNTYEKPEARDRRDLL